MAVGAGETDSFLGGIKSREDAGCCRSKCASACFVVMAVLGAVFLLLGLAVLFVGEGVLEAKIMESMALTPGSDRMESWLRPPVQPHLEGYAFHVTNPEEVLRGAKPVLEERGPYVYSSTTIKDADDNIKWDEGDTVMTYRPRKVYKFVPELSGEGLDPYNDYLTVPNIPLWTGLHSLRHESGLAKSIGLEMVTNNGLGTPFINLTFDGLLWGYEDDLPCLKLDYPSSCDSGDANDGGGFGGGSDDDDAFGFGDSDDDGFGFGDSDSWGEEEDEEGEEVKSEAGSDGITRRNDGFSNPDEDPASPWYGQAKPKAEVVDCKCEWGLFRDRNVTMRKPIRFLSGVGDLSLKGVVKEYDGATELGWWQKGSTCDAVGGQDSSTLPPMLSEETRMDIFIDLMCRSLPVEFEKEVEHAGIRTLRFIPPANAMGAHDDPDAERRNEANACYCLEEEKFQCFKSGVLNMEPCKRDVKAPLALSMPHFYQADPSFLAAVDGLSPNKERHEFFMDIVPEFGFPLSIRPRFQLNVVVGSATFPDWDTIAGMTDQIVLPFLWAQDGFQEPSDELAEAIAFGLAAPQKLPTLGAVVFFALGGVLLLAGLVYFMWRRSTRSADLGKPSVVAT